MSNQDQPDQPKQPSVLKAAAGSAARSAWGYRIAVAWFFLFSVNALCTTIIASLTGTKWATLDFQSKFLILTAITGNWTGTIMAFISKQAKRTDAGLPDPPSGGGTDFFYKQPTPTTSSAPTGTGLLKG